MKFLTLIMIVLYVAVIISEIRRCCFSCWFKQPHIRKYLRTAAAMTFHTMLLHILLSGNYSFVFSSISYLAAYLVLLIMYVTCIYINLKMVNLITEIAYIEFLSSCTEHEMAGLPMPPQPWKKFEDSPIYMSYLIQYDFDDYLKLLKIDPESMK